MKNIVIVEANKKYVFSNEKEVIEQFLGQDYYELNKKEQYEKLKLKTFMNATIRKLPVKDIQQGEAIENMEEEQYILWDEETFLLSLAKNNDIVMYEKENANMFAKNINKENLERVNKEYIRINDCANALLKNKIQSLELRNKRKTEEENEKIKKALAEVDIILENTELEIKNKIPDKFQNYIKENKDDKHRIQLQTEKGLIEQNIRKETKEILALIYREYLCTKEERQKLIAQERQEREKEKREKYDINVEEILENRRNKKETNQMKTETEKALIEIAEEKWYQEIIHKVLKIFKIK